jgi:pimeloyl-ACP methyl ester carboxylesterase
MKRKWLAGPCAAAMGVLLLAAAAPRDVYVPYESAQRLVDVGNGRRLNIYCSGSGSPTVVLDAAIGSSMYVWHTVQPALARHVRVCSYDRAGYGFSDPGGLPHTTRANVTDLHALLTNAHIRPPYVLVAHSLNGFDAYLFADRYRGEVAGMVLIDPSDVDEDRFASIYGKKKYDAALAADVNFLQGCDQKADRHVLKPGGDCVDSPDPHLPERLRRVQGEHSTGQAMWDAVKSERLSLQADIREVTSEQRAYGGLPLVVLTAGAAEDAEKQAGATGAQIAAAKRLWKELRDRDAARSSRGVNCIIPGASHYMQIDKPDVVIRAVLQTVDAGRTAATPSCAKLR